MPSTQYPVLSALLASVLACALLALAAADETPDGPTGDASTLASEAEPTTPPASIDADGRRILFDVKNNGAGAMLELLRRAEELTDPEAGPQPPSVAIVLHGPDLALFDENHQRGDRAIIDLAGRLDARGVIDFKACRATAARLGIDPDTLPGFLEAVPYGPTEIRELKQRGYTEL